MTLKLLLSLLFIVWRLSSAEEYTNHWLASEDIASVEFCSHDGYLNGTACACDTDYSGNFCLNRKCRNFGFDGRLGTDGQGTVGTVDRCICPPGFLGRNCEPVKCVGGDQQLYTRSKNEKAISLLASFNSRMSDTWNTGNIGNLVCNYTAYSRNFNYNFDNVGISIPIDTTQEDCSVKVKKFLDPDTCKDEDDETPVPCQQLNVANLNTLVQNSPPDSIVFVVTNMAATSADSSLSEKIIGTAIAKRIQINVIVYNNTLPFLYASDPTLTYLSNIAAATFGTFVLPSVDSNNEQYDIVAKLLNLWDSDIGVSVVYTKEFPTLPIDTSSDLYIAGQTRFSEDLTFNTDLPAVVTKSDFWKLYKLPAGSFNPRLSISGQVDGTPIIVYSAARIRAYSGFTSNVLTESVIDVSYSISVKDASYPLVFRLESDNRVLTFYDIKQTIGTPQTVSLSSLSSRTQCQFGLIYEATCTSVGASLVTILTTDGHTVSFPVYCASFDFAANVYNNLIQSNFEVTHLAKRQSLAQDVACTNSVNHEKVGLRSFSIICENSKDTDASKSSVDNVFRNKNSVFYQLTSYVNSPGNLYTSYLAVLNNGNNAVLQQSNDYGKFLTKVMTATNEASSHSSDAVDITGLLVQTIQTANEYSDILFVVNYNVSIDSGNPKTIKEQLAIRRSRLYVTFVQTYVNISSDVYEYANDLAVGSGGVAVRLNDYSDLNKFFIQYFPLLVANDIVAKSYSENMKAGIALNNVYMSTDQHILLVTNQDNSGDGIVNATVTVSGIGITALPQIGELQLFTLTPQKAGVYNILVLFSTSGLARLANAVLLTNTANPDIVSLSFLDKDNKNRNDVVYGEGKFAPYFYSSAPFSIGSTVTITYSDPQNPAKPVYSGSIINATTGCDSSSYTYTTDFSWICSISGGLYHFKIDRVSENGTISRTFPITCLGESSGDCLNGGTQNGDVCSCPLEWSGSKCETPVCQNGGSRTAADTCDCGPAFTGDFCELRTTTCLSPEPTKPEYLSDLSSLFIVADSQALQVSSLASGLDITGVPINVILYGDGNGARLVQSTTNGQHLVEVLGTPSVPATLAPNSNDSMYNAINFALDNQFTSRSLIVVLTSNPDSDVDSDLLIRLAAKRAEIRVLSTSAATPLSSNYLTLSLVGNGVPYVIQSDGFDKYLRSYIVPLFQSLGYQKDVPQRVFNVFQTGTVGATAVNIKIPADSTFDDAQSQAFIHVVNGRSDQGNPLGSVGNTQIYSLPFTSKDGSTITIEQNAVGVSGFYSVEVVSYLKTAYGFNNDTSGSNEALNYGLSLGQSNTITISPAPDATLPTSNPSNFPYLLIREITNGTVGNATTVLFTRKSGPGCFFKFFSALNVCSQDTTIGYQAQLITRTQNMEARQQQFVLTCHQTSYKKSGTSCGGKGSPYPQLCNCDTGFIGIDCSLPICENGGVRDNTVCRCPLYFYGRRCEQAFVALPTTTSSPVSSTTALPETTQTIVTSQSTAVTSETTTGITTTQAPETRAVAFVIDVVGTDDYAFNQTTQAILEYVKAFNNVHYVMLVGNWNISVALGFKQYDSFDDLSSKLSLFWTLRKQASDTKIASLSKALQAISSSYTQNSASLASTSSMNIFYTTQIGLSADDDPTSSMIGLEKFKKSSVVFSPFAANADQTILDSLKKFDDSVTNVRDFYNGVKTMVTNTDKNSDAVLPEKPSRTCAFGLQANINVPIDRSYSSSTTIAANLKKFLVNFRETFNYIENDSSGRCQEDVLPNYYNERAAMTAFAYYDAVVKSSTFCPSQYTSYINFDIVGKNTNADYTNKTVKYIAKNINQNNCVCNRFEDDKTFKYIIWLPRSSAPLKYGDIDLQPMLKLDTTNAYHFVVPFYDVTDKASDLYYQILADQDTVKQKGADWYLLPNAEKTDVDEIIATLNEKLCEIAGVDPTAIPPQLDSMHSSSRHDGIYSELWN